MQMTKVVLWLRWWLLLQIVFLLHILIHSNFLQAWHEWSISIFYKLNNDTLLQNMFIIIDECKPFQGVILIDLAIYVYFFISLRSRSAY